MKKFCLVALMPLFYIFYLPVVVIKDLVDVLYAPFDTNRFVNAYVALFGNAKIASDSILNWKPGEHKEEEPKEEQSIGFKVYPSNAPGLPGPETEDYDDWEENDL